MVQRASTERLRVALLSGTSDKFHGSGKLAVDRIRGREREDALYLNACRVIKGTSASARYVTTSFSALRAACFFLFYFPFAAADGLA